MPFLPQKPLNRMEHFEMGYGGINAGHAYHPAMAPKGLEAGRQMTDTSVSSSSSGKTSSSVAFSDGTPDPKKIQRDKEAEEKLKR